MSAERNSSHCGAKDSVCIQTEKVYDICKDKECLNKARKMSAFSRAFEMSVPNEIYNQLETELRNIE